MVLPALLQHHLSIQARPGSAAAGADTAWSDAITAAVSTAAASTVLQPVLQQELAGWLGSVQSWLTAAAAQAGVSLQQQLQLLTSAHVACFALPAAAGGRDMKCSQLPGDVLASCLKLLINLQPSRITSSGSTTSSSGSSSKEGSCGLSTLELTDRLLQLHAALLLQLVSAAAAAAGPWLTRDVRQQLTNR
jgi:hypothetical protein